MQRIRAPSTPEQGSPVIYLQHGILSTADCWIGNYAHNSPAFVFALEGFDVWLGNNRGTTHSLKHKTLDPSKDKEFWNYSFVDLGKFDVPAQIEFALNSTAEEKLTYIGHSQGTTQMFFALAENEDYLKERVNLFIALAPVIRLSNAKDGLLGYVSDHESYVESALSKLGIHDLFSHDWDRRYGFKMICNVIPFLCSTGKYFFITSQTDYNDQSRINISSSKFPGGTSVKQLIHFAQLIKDTSFQYFNYRDPELNEAAYGPEFRDQPPTIDLTRI
mmetsp:Transcript_14661/g.24981  ORF Transcript_14661/g.24981 Transcript_14661/m.24981 type:complete len:275 (+) Transcript_14661:632-1456(+)